MYLSLMGTFSCPAPVLMIGSSFGGASSLLNSVSFCTTHMEDPWILPSPSTSSMPVKTDVPLPTIMVAYQAKLIRLQSLVLPLRGRRRRTRMCCLHGQLSPLMHMIASTMFFHRMKPLLRTCLGLSHLRKSYIIDLIFFESMIVLNVRTLGRFLARRLVVLWFH